MLSNGTNVHYVDKFDGTTPIHAAEAANDPKLVQMMIDAGAYLNPQDAAGKTPAYNAIIDGMKEEGPTTLGVLIKAGADLSIQNQSGETPIFPASRVISGHISSLKELLVAKVDVNVVDQDGNTPLHHSVSSDQYANEIAIALLNAGANVDSKNKNGQTPFHFAVESERVHSVWLLLSAWQKLGMDDETCATLCDVAMEGDREIAASLGYKLDITDTIARGCRSCKMKFSRVETT